MAGTSVSRAITAVEALDHVFDEATAARRLCGVVGERLPRAHRDRRWFAGDEIRPAWTAAPAISPHSAVLVGGAPSHEITWSPITRSGARHSAPPTTNQCSTPAVREVNCPVSRCARTEDAFVRDVRVGDLGISMPRRSMAQRSSEALLCCGKSLNEPAGGFPLVCP